MKIDKKATKIAIWVFCIEFVIAFFSNYSESILSGIQNGLLGGLFVGIIVLLFANSAIKNKMEYEWYNWVIYVIGLIGLGIPLFWLIMLFIYFSKHYGEPFFNQSFHDAVYFTGNVIFWVCLFFGIIGGGYLLFF